MAAKVTQSARSAALCVYAIVAMDGEPGKILGAMDGCLDGMQLLGQGKFGAVVMEAAEDASTVRDRQELARRLLAHQQVVERIMAVTPVLPVKFATLAPDRESVERCLEKGSEIFAAAFEDLAGKTQFEIVVTWDIARVFAEISEEPAVARLKADLAVAPGNADQEDRARLGLIVKQALERRRGELGGGLSEALSKVALDSIANPLMDDRMVLNLALLVADEPTDALDRCLDSLDAAHDGKLSFRCVGPLPPHSFATVEIAFLGADRIAQALGVLELGTVQGAEEVRAAYRRLAKQTHPDVVSGHANGDRMTVLHDAYKMLLSFVDAGGPVIVSVRRQEAAYAVGTAAGIG